MSGQVSIHASETATRLWISPRQAETLHALVDAALLELRSSGYEGLTVRGVARRAGVAPATAYNYFSSKEHLVTELFWRRLQALEDPVLDRRRTVANRVAGALEDFAAFVGSEPALAQACTAAMLGADLEVARLRRKIGAEMHRRVAVAAGDDADEDALVTIDLVVTGALVNAGMGHMAYDDLGSVLTAATARVLNGDPS